MGFGFDTAQLAERDPWKYDRLLRELDRRIAEDPRDLAALVYRGNASYFQIDRGDQAERDYREALSIAPEDRLIRANLERLSKGPRR